MTTYIALLRAVNVGGTGRLPMADLRNMCVELGFGRIETYVASGNVVFDCDLSPQTVQAELEKRLHVYAGKAVDVFVRTAAQMRIVLKKNPFADREPQFVYSFFLHEKPRSDVLDSVRGRDGEDMRLGQREIYVHYPKGMGQSKLQIPAAKPSTARNLHTVLKLVEISSRK